MSVIPYPLEATEYTAEDVQTYLSTRTSGVFSDDITFTAEGMTVAVSPFLAWMNYAKFKGCSVAVTAPETVSFSPAHAVLDRIDRIVLRLDLTLNRAYLTVLEGVPASNPVPQNITRTEIIYDLCLAEVTIPAGETEIFYFNIKSTLLDEELCGIMRDGVTGIPTAHLQLQAEELIERLHDTISEQEENVLDLIESLRQSIADVQGDAAWMIREIYDPKGGNKQVAFENEVWKTVYPISSRIFTSSVFFDPSVIFGGGNWVSQPVKRFYHYTHREAVNEAEVVTPITVNISNNEKIQNAIIVPIAVASYPHMLSVSVGNVNYDENNYLTDFTINVWTKAKGTVNLSILVIGEDEKGVTEWARMGDDWTPTEVNLDDNI